MNQEDKEFLKQLQHEMLTQDTVCQANPRFWVVMETVKDYWVEDDIAGICIYDSDAAENVFEGEIDEELASWLKEEFHVIKKCKYDKGTIEIICKDKNKYYINDISDIKDFLDEYDYDRYSICYYREREEIAKDTMFLTLRECKEHIKRNHYHYNKPHSYAMTALRSPQVERLYKILEETDWDNVIISSDKNDSYDKAYEKVEPRKRIYDTKSAIEYMKTKPYQNVLVRLKDGKLYGYDYSGNIKINKGMWLSPSSINISDDEQWRLPDVIVNPKD